MSWTFVGSAEDDPAKELCHLRFKEIEGHCIVQDKGDTSSLVYYNEPLKTMRVNIGTEDEPKLAIVGDCWDAAKLGWAVHIPYLKTVFFALF